MKIEQFIRPAPLSKVAEGSCVLFAGRGRQLGIVMKRNGDPSISVAILRSWGQAEKQTPRVRAFNSLSETHAFELLDVEAHISADLSRIYPDALQRDAEQLWRAGALVVSGEDHRVIIAHQNPSMEYNFVMVSLTDGSVHWGKPQRGDALVTSWSIVHRVGDEIRPVCRLDVQAPAERADKA